MRLHIKHYINDAIQDGKKNAIASPLDTKELALTLEGKKRKLQWEHFMQLRAINKNNKTASVVQQPVVLLSKWKRTLHIAKHLLFERKVSTYR